MEAYLYGLVITDGGLTTFCRFNWRRVLVRSEIGTPVPSEDSLRLIRYSSQRSFSGTKLLVEWR